MPEEDLNMPKEDLMMKLPGELRNRIYELVLPKDEAIEIRKRKGRSMEAPVCYSRYSRGRKSCWHEPDIMAVSSQIRTECLRLYYDNNTFEIFARSHELHLVLDFLLLKSTEDCIALKFKIRIVGSEWRNMQDWLELASIAYYTDKEYSDKIDVAVCNFHLREAVRQVVRLGFRARDRGMDWEELKMEFDEWVMGTTTLLGRYIRSIG